MSSVLDASAVLALLQNESGSARVQLAIATGAFISAANVAEVVTRLVDQGLTSVDARACFDDLALDVVPLDGELAYRVAALRVATRSLGLSLGDRCCLALAQHLGLPALTTDRAWSQVQLGVTVEVIR